ncbi:hypothetical protein AB0M39_19870 [Streptomyces sp. NPDC051907]|uniref:hypothetical protein n=1 Tax=Streptomyces sp. NPDC051907 TaxID=3155284 RepID=UPI00342B21F1
MNIVLRRVFATTVLLGGIALALWCVFGAPHDWTGGQRLLRLALGVTAMGLITASTWLMFPGTRGKDEEHPAAGHDIPPAPGPLDV